MNTQSISSLRKLVTLGALLLLAATASGCGVGLPTQPDVDASAVNERVASPAGIPALDPALEMGGGDGGSGNESPVPPAEENILVPGPGNSDWGHTHKKP